MTEALGIFFVAIAVIAVTAILFGGWAVVSLVKLIGRAIGGACGVNSSKAPLQKECSNSACGAINPGDARYCRRCGRALPGTKQRSMSRAALW